MNACEIVAQAETLGITLVADGAWLRLRPKSLLTPDLLESLQTHKAEIMCLLTLRGWPEESFDAVARFGHPSARLHPFLGRIVASSAGAGRLVYIGEHCAAILLDKEPRRLTYQLPWEVRPHGVPEMHEDLGVGVN